MEVTRLRKTKGLDVKSNSKKLAVGAIVAAAAGYVAGVLTAPKKGTATREDLVSAGIKTRNEAEKKFKKINDELNNLINEAADFSKTAKKNVKSELPKLQNAAKQAKIKVREVLSSIHEGDALDEDLREALKNSSKAIKDLKNFLTKTKKA